MPSSLPVAVIGAGPVGLAAAVALRARGYTPVVLEAGPVAGHGILRWGHVRMFSPWRYDVDRLGAALLRAHGWVEPDPESFPTGRELVERYVQPLADTPELAPHVRYRARVTAIARRRLDRMKNAQRGQAPYLVRYERDGEEHELLARAVIDASGTYDTPNPLGASGIPALGERGARARIAYGIPDVLGRDRDRYAGRRVLVVGSGHSALNALADLARLADEHAGMQLHWAVRRPTLRRALGGGDQDQLVERGRLGQRIAALVAQGRLVVHAGFHLDRIERTPDGVVAHGQAASLPAVDEIIGATGFRPDLAIVDEVRLDLDPGTQAPSALAPLIDPNLHSCGSVRPHGALELRHPDADFYLVGMKSYGRAPTFLLLTGYEQVRSVVAAIAGDWEAARRVELELPETGVCSTDFSDEDDAIATASPASCCGPKPAAVPAVAASNSACCGGPAEADASACCVADEDAKAVGEAGCGCAGDPAVAADLSRKYTGLATAAIEVVEPPAARATSAERAERRGGCCAPPRRAAAG